MNYAVLDVREWDITIDLERGTPITGEIPGPEKRRLQLARRLIKDHPYPGDFALESMEWVTDGALRLWKAYDPTFMFISYAQPQILGGVVDMTTADWRRLIDRQFQNVDRFLAESGFTPIIIGLGDLVPIEGYVDLSSWDSYVRKPDRLYAGLYGLEDEDDFSRLTNTPGVERLISKEDFIANFGAGKDFARRLPDYLVIAKEGHTFKTMGGSPRMGLKTVARNWRIPVYTALDDAIQSIVDVNEVVLRNAGKERIALIVLDGIGIEDFQGPHELCANNFHWYTYSQGDDSYLALGTGKHFQFNDYPPGWLSFVEDPEDKRCPHDGYITRLVPDSIGSVLRKQGISSGAVGSRSTFTHLASGADICVECCCCDLYNYGTKAVIYTT